MQVDPKILARLSAHERAALARVEQLEAEMFPPPPPAPLEREDHHSKVAVSAEEQKRRVDEMYKNQKHY